MAATGRGVYFFFPTSMKEIYSGSGTILGTAVESADLLLLHQDVSLTGRSARQESNFTNGYNVALTDYLAVNEHRAVHI